MTLCSRSLRRRSLIIAGLLAILLPVAAGPAAAQQIWFNLTNYNMPGGVDGAQGYRKLFDDRTRRGPTS